MKQEKMNLKSWKMFFFMLIGMEIEESWPLKSANELLDVRDKG